MRIKIVIVLLFIFNVGGCTAANGEGRSSLPVSYALEGTSTAVVGIAVDVKTGIPKETVKSIVLTPGQKVIFAGPDRFSIKFKNKKSPNGVIKYQSTSGVILISIPKDILEDKRYEREFNKNKELRFEYSIIVNGKELDPPIIIKREG